MKKTFIIITIAVILCVLSACSVKMHTVVNENKAVSSVTKQTECSKVEKKTETTSKKTESASKAKQENTKPVSDFSMKNALFIGDSRTIGLMEYSGLPSDFFANVGMSVYNIYDKKISVPNVGKLSLENLLTKKQYNVIYLMLGINELGYNIETTASEYKKLVSFINSKQPDAVIIIQKNLHVTKVKSASEKYINNERLDNLNSKIAENTNNKNIFSIDANILFDDRNNALDANKTADNVHLYAKYYSEWGNWLTKESEKIFKEINN